MANYSLGLAVARFIAEGEARAGNFEAIYPEHLWMALTKISDLANETILGLVDLTEAEKAALLAETDALRQWFAAQKMDTIRLRRKLRTLLGKGKGVQGQLHRAPASMAFFEAAAQLAETNHESVVSLFYLNAALLTNPPPRLAELLIEAGYLAQQPPPSQLVLERNRVSSRNSVSSAQTQQPGILDVLGRDLTALAQRGELTPLIGRREELRRLAQILIQQRKGHALLIGEAGVGKTCLVEGLAQQVVSPQCVPAFRGKRIIELSLAVLLAGAALRGEFEARVAAVIREAEADPNIILFIDEFHTMMTPGGGLDAANMLKPALTRRKMHLIGATTTPDYERYFARDEAIARRFEILWLEEPSRDEAIAILTGAKPGLEGHYGLQITPAAITAAVTLALRYLPDRRLPDKALDLLDQACAQKALQSLSLKTPGRGMASTLKKEANLVDQAEIARVVAKRCRIPYELLAQSDQERLQRLEPALMQRIIGQAKAIRQIRDTLQAASQGLREARRPIASFLFAGPTGVGKTEMAKVLAEFLFGTPDNLIRIDLSEYQERHQVARLLGAPPGYIGYEEPGLLTAALRRRPASVVLFDEVEKAHPDVLNVLLQILDEGELTDGQGRKAFFREAVVILTSNLLLDTKPIGFNVAPAQPEQPNFAEQRREVNMAALRTYLRPELIGRIGHIILFEALSRDALRAIAEQLLQNYRQQLQGQPQAAELPAELRPRILAQISALPFGARELAQLVKAEVTAWLLRRSGNPPG